MIPERSIDRVALIRDAVGYGEIVGVGFGNVVQDKDELLSISSVCWSTRVPVHTLNHGRTVQ